MSEGKGFRFVLNKDYLIVEIERMETETVGGLLVPFSEYIKGTVVSAGPGYNTPYGFINNSYLVGDKVLLEKSTLESAKAKRIPQNMYEDGLEGNRVVDLEVAAYLITSDFVIGKWEKKESCDE
jgi:co-chaperonin GroES (HSP10)